MTPLGPVSLMSMSTETRRCGPCLCVAHKSNSVVVISQGAPDPFFALGGGEGGGHRPACLACALVLHWYNLFRLQYEDVDLAAEGGFLRPVVKEFLIVPTGPTMIIELKAKVQNPMINGIEIYSGEVVVPDMGKHIPCLGLAVQWRRSMRRLAVPCVLAVLSGPDVSPTP